MSRKRSQTSENWRECTGEEENNKNLGPSIQSSSLTLRESMQVLKKSQIAMASTKDPYTLEPRTLEWNVKGSLRILKKRADFGNYSGKRRVQVM